LFYLFYQNACTGKFKDSINIAEKYFSEKRSGQVNLADFNQSTINLYAPCSLWLMVKEG